MCATTVGDTAQDFPYSGPLFDTLPLGIVFQDGQGRIVAANPAAERVLGLTLDQMRGITSIDPRWHAVHEDGTPFPGTDHPAMVALRTGQPVLDVVMGIFNPILDQQTWISICATPIFGEAGKQATGVYAVFQDISDRKRAESQLRKSEERLRLALGSAHQGWFDLNVRTGEVAVSPEYPVLLGYEPAEFQSSLQNWLDNVHPDDRPGLMSAYQGALRTGQAAEMEYRRRTKSGAWKWIRSVGQVVERDTGGQPLRMTGIHTDITVHKQSESALSESRNLLRTIIDTAPIRVFWKDRKLRYLGCNPAFAKDAGCSDPGELTGMDDRQLAWAELAERYRSDDLAVIESGIGKLYYEEPQKTPAGQTIWLRTSKVPLRDEAQETIGVLGIYEDITERKQAELLLDIQHKFAGFLLEGPCRPQLCEAILDSALRLPGLNAGGLYWRRPEGDYDLVAHRGLSSRFIAQVGHLPVDSPQVEIIRRGDLQCSCSDSSEHCTDQHLVRQPALANEGIRALVILPIHVNGEPVACLNLASFELNFVPAAEVTALETLARQFAQALERTRAAEESAHRQENLAGLFNAIDDYIFVVAPDGRILHYNRAVAESLGYGDSLIGQSIVTLHPPERRAEAESILAALVAGHLASCPLPVLKADGTQLMVDTRAVLGNWAGEPAIIGVSRDITEQLRQEAALGQAKQFSDDLINGLPGIFFLLDQAGHMVRWNQRFLQITGYSESGLNGMPATALFSGEDVPRIAAAIGAALDQGEASVEGTLEIVGGGSAPYLFAGRRTMIDDRPFVVGLGVDISAQRQAEQALAEEAVRRRIFFEQSNDGICVVDVQGRVIEANAAFADMLGYTMEELADRHVWDWDLRSQEEMLSELAAFVGGSRTFETRHRRSDGTIVDVEVSVNAAIWQGQMLLYGVHRNISRRKAAEAALREREEVFSAIVNRAVDGLLLVDAETMDFTEFNDAACQGLGYTREEFACLKLPDVQGNLTPTETWEKVKIAAATPDGLRFENRHRHKDGSLRERRISNRPIQIHGRTYLAHVWHDVTNEKRADRVLAESALFLRETQAIAHVGGWKANPVTDMLLWTEEVYRLVEHPLNQPPIGLEDGLRYYAPAYQPEIRRLLLAAWEHGTPFTFETEMIAASGRHFWAELRCIGRVDTDDGSTFITGTFQDISARKQVEGELANYRHDLEAQVRQRTADLQETNRKLRDTQFAMNSVGIGIHWVDADTGRFLYVNRYAAEMLGYSKSAMLGMSVPDIDPNFQATTYHDRTEAVRQQGHARFESVNRTRDGRLIPVEVSIHFLPGSDDMPARFITFLTDISRRKEAALALMQAKEAAEAANLAKSTFLANMSHEIRTPMNAIVGLTHILRKKITTPEHADKLGKIAGAADHLLGVINDILDISKIEANKLILEQSDFDLAALLSRVSQMVMDRVHAKHLELVVDTEPGLGVVNGDATRLGQALLNYLGNAVKFTETGTIVLRARAIEDGPDGVLLRFEVRDTGIGIAAENVPRLFKAFEQADSSTTRKFGGTGLGLAITRRLAELMGGEVGVTSLPGIGSTFWLTARLGRVKSEPGRYQIAALTGQRALVVDDTAVTRLVQTQLLRMVGLEGDGVASGAEALTAMAAGDAEGRPFHLAMLDLHMPDMDGFETLARLRRLPLRQQPLALLVTASGDPAILEDAQRAGFADVLLKPLSATQLHAWMTQHLSAILGCCKDAETSSAPVMSDASVVLRRDYPGTRLLLVEDDPINQEVALLVLEETGCQVDVADNGRLAIDRVAANDYDLILMDMQMPVMDGVEATRAIRQLPNGKTVPILAMTANAFAEDKERCLAAGMNDFVTKPVMPNVLFDAMLRWLPQPGHAGSGAGGDKPLVNEEPHDVAAADPHAQLKAIEGIDFPYALQVSRGNLDKYRQLLGKFIASSRDTLDDLPQLLISGDLAGARKITHRLKGSSGVLGLTRLQALIDQLEAQLQAGQTNETTTDLATSLQAHFQLLADSVAQLPDNPAQGIDGA